MSVSLIIAVVAVVLCAVFLIRGLGGSPASRLRQEYFRSVPMSRAQAEQALARHLAGLQQRFPGQSDVWYLQRILGELRRDRR